MNSLESELVSKNTSQFPTNNQEVPRFETSFLSNNLHQVLNIPFLETKVETKTDKAHKILGESANNIPTEQLETFIVQLEFLTNSWLDSYEKQLFNGKTLREITKLDSP